MSSLSVQQRLEILVIDSRIIAQQLEIQHKNFLATIEKYLVDIENAFGTVAFETREFKTSRGNRSTERWAWLTEEQATFLMTLSRNTQKVVECKVALVKAFSEAKKIIQQTIPSQSEEIQKLKLQLELAKTQEKLLLSTSAIATMHSPEMVALVLGKPDAIVTQIKEVPTVITVDHRGNAFRFADPFGCAQFDGIGIMALAKRYGFGKNTQACRKWLESIGITDEQWLCEPTFIKSKKLPREMLTWLDKQFANKKGIRQTIIGEGLF